MKSKVKNIIIILLALCWIALMLSTCGGRRINAGQLDKRKPHKVETIEPTPTPTPSPTPTPTPEPTPTPKPVSPEVLSLLPRNLEVEKEMAERYGMMGRLYIPSVGIDVALISDDGGGSENEADIRQAICDAPDSASIYPDRGNIIIADHNNQGFATLMNVKSGDMAYILRGTSIMSLECYMVIDGINTGKGITDLEGTPANFYSEFLCYTCKEDWTNVTVVCFDAVDEDFF